MSVLYPVKSQKIENSSILNELFGSFICFGLVYLMLEMKFSFSATIF